MSDDLEGWEIMITPAGDMEDYPEVFSEEDIALDWLGTNKDLFFYEVEQAYGQYNKDRDWQTLAAHLWETFDFYIGTGKSRKSDRPQNRLQHERNTFRKSAQRFYSAVFQNSFRYLDDAPKEQSCQELKQLLRSVECDRDMEEATSHGESWYLPMYPLIINEIKREIAHQEERVEDQPASIPVSPEESKEATEPVIDRASLEQRTTLNTSEAAIYLGVKKNYLYKLTSANKIPVYRPGGKVMNFKRAELDVWLSQNRNMTSEELEVEASTYVTLNKGNQSGVSSNNVRETQTFSSFEDFCLEKIREMEAEERTKFLSTNRGDDSYYELSMSWKHDYQRDTGKTIKDFSAPISRAKRRYREESEN